MPERNRAADSRLSPAQRRREIIEIIAEGLVGMPLAAPIPPDRAILRQAKNSQEGRRKPLRRAVRPENSVRAGMRGATSILENQLACG